MSAEQDMQTAGEALAWAARCLAAAGIESARREAEILVREAMAFRREQFLAHPETPLSPLARRTLEEAVARRAAREPLPYILGRAEFFSLTFTVTPAVLIPRPETEVLVEESVARARAIDARVIVDVGAGSGAIAVVLARELPQARILAVDISAEALAVTRENAMRHGVGPRVLPLRADLLSALRGPVEAVVANLPYIKTDDLGGLQPEVRAFEPRAAVDGGYDGLAAIRRLSAEVASVLTPSGFAALEIGAGQADAVAELLAAGGLQSIERVRDYAGLERVVIAWR